MISSLTKDKLCISLASINLSSTQQLLYPFSKMFKAFRELPTMGQRVHSNRNSLLIKAEERLFAIKTEWRTGSQERDRLDSALVQPWVTFTMCLWPGAEGTKYLLSPTMYHPCPISFQRIQHLLEYNHWEMTRCIQCKFFPSECLDTDPDKEKEQVCWRKTERERWGESECKGHSGAPQRKSKLMREEALEGGAVRLMKGTDRYRNRQTDRCGSSR